MLKKLNLFEYIRLIFFIYLLNLFSLFFKPQNNYISITSSGGKFYADNPKYIFEYFLKTTRSLKICFFVKNKKLCELNENIIYLYSFKAFFHILKSKLFIVNCYDYIFYNLPFRKRIIFQTYHGIPLRKIEADTPKNARFYLLKKIGLLRFFLKENYEEYVLCTSKKFVPFFSSAFPGAKIVNLGYPRNDYLLNSTHKTNKYSKYQKVILYAPTWRGKDYDFIPFSSSFLKKLNEFFKINNYVFLIKAHPKVKHILKENYSNILDISMEIKDIQLIYAFVDILISDYSSVIFDFVLLDRPVITYIKDFKKYLKMWPTGFYFDFKKTLPGPFAYTETELMYYLKNIKRLFNDKTYKKKYIKFKKFGHDYFDGNSSKRVYKYIVENLI